MLIDPVRRIRGIQSLLRFGSIVRRLAGDSLRNDPKTRLQPQLDSLETRDVTAIGQVTLLLSPPAPSGTAVRGDLPDGSINVTAFSFDATNPIAISGATGGTGSGRLAFGALEINAEYGRHSGPLFQAEANGARFPTGLLTVRDEAARRIATYEFGTVFVTSSSYSGASGDSSTTEHYSFLFGSLRLTTYNPATNLSTGVGMWNQVTNTSNVPASALNAASLNAAFANSFSTDAAAAAVSSLSTDTADVTLQAAQAASGETRIATTVQLSTTRRNGVGGRPVTLRARVNSSAGAPVGDVTFYAGKTLLGSAPVGSNGVASLTVAASALGRSSKPFAIFSGAPDSKFLPSTTVRDGGRLQRLFQRSFDRPMTQDEWTLSSIWIQQGINMTPIYRRLASQVR